MPRQPVERGDPAHGDRAREVVQHLTRHDRVHGARRERQGTAVREDHGELPRVRQPCGSPVQLDPQQAEGDPVCASRGGRRARDIAEPGPDIEKGPRFPFPVSRFPFPMLEEPL